jgi:hypothetical protein
MKRLSITTLFILGVLCSCKKTSTSPKYIADTQDTTTWKGNFYGTDSGTIQLTIIVDTLTGNGFMFGSIYSDMYSYMNLPSHIQVFGTYPLSGSLSGPFNTEPVYFKCSNAVSGIDASIYFDIDAITNWHKDTLLPGTWYDAWSRYSGNFSIVKQ